MSNLFRALTRPEEQRAAFPAVGLDEWVGYFGFGGLDYPFITHQSMGGNDREEIEASFSGYVEGAYKRNGIVFACMVARMLIFSEARFQFQQMRNGRPGDLFGTGDLAIFETPWPNGTTGDLLSRMIQDVDLAGNFYGTRRPGPGGQPRIERLRPDWVTIISGESKSTLDLELLGYAYQPGGPQEGRDPVFLLPENVAHYAPIPDPLARHRGMSWVTPVLREIMGDGAATNHKLKYFEQGATPNLVVTLGQVDLNPDSFQTWVDKMEGQHAGWVNAYKTLYLAAGADAKVVGSDLKQVDFKAVQGHGETRIAAAARIPPVIVGLSEGLDAATYSNYAQARRAFADGTIRPLWRNAAGSLANLVKVPSGARLWYDDRDIPFLQEDQKDAADIRSTQATTIHSLVSAGYTPESAVTAAITGDFSVLQHTGMFSVQLLPAGTVTEGKGSLVQGATVPTNGNGSTSGA